MSLKGFVTGCTSGSTWASFNRVSGFQVVGVLRLVVVKRKAWALPGE